MSLLRKLDTRFGDFDGVAAKLPPVLRPVFRPDTLFEGPSPYVVDGVVTWGYVLPFFLSNFILILTALILFSTWLQGWITARLSAAGFAALARTIAAMAAGLVQVAVLFPLEKYVLFRKE